MINKKNFVFESSTFHKVVIFVISFVFYFNAIPNEIALDDVMVLSNNQFVLKGINGIPEIVTHESFYGAIGKNPGALGWRYRPLSLIVFAFEHQFFGNSWHAYHFMNVFFYSILLIVIYNFLKRWLFPFSIFTAFLSTIVFTVHPIHTEVVANIKSLDEILALLFSLLFLNQFIVFDRDKKNKDLFLSLLLLLAAMTSKESSLILIAFAPISLWVFNKSNFKNCIFKPFPIYLFIIAYFVVRISISGIPSADINIMNDPYLYATGFQKQATISLILGRYLLMMVWPAQLVMDYGYNQIPYVNFDNWKCILSTIIYLFLLGISCFLIFKQEALGFCILFYVVGIILLSNLFFNVGPPMAERFLFTPSLFIIVAFFLFINTSIRKIGDANRTIFVSVFFVLFLSFSFIKVYGRNKEWKNNSSLYFADVVKSTNSVRLQAFCGMILVPESDNITDSISRIQSLNLALNFFYRAYAIYPNFTPMYQDWGGAYSRLNNLDSCEWVWNRLKILNPNSKFIPINDDELARRHYNIWNEKFQKAIPKNNINELLSIHQQSMFYYDKMPDSWATLGKLYMLSHKSDSAIWAFKKCLLMDSLNVDAKQYLIQLEK